MKRHNARILTVMVLYNLDMNQHLNEEILEDDSILITISI